MKKITLFYIVAGLLALGAPALRADATSTNQPPATAATPQHHPRDNREFLRAVGLKPADLKGLSREDRKSKIQSAAETTASNLKQKEANGTITDQEKTDLAMIEKHLQRSKNAANTQ